MRCVVLHVYEGDEGFMDTFGFQVATIQDYDSLEDAATCNVGNYPAYDKRGKPYRVVVIPEEAWNEFQVYAESKQGRRSFVAYPSEDPTIR